MTPTPTIDSDPIVRKPHRWRPGTVALREIRKQQASVKKCLPKAAFERLVREVIAEVSTSATRIKPEAIEALQQGAEDHIVALLQRSQRYALHSRRVTLNDEDLKLAVEDQNKEIGVEA